MGTPSIIVHGGAGRVPRSEIPARLDGCHRAARAGWAILVMGGSALDAAETAVAELEDNPLFNAGRGSTLNSLGRVEMDAAIMANHPPRAGAVAAVQRIKNPIKLARRILEDGRHVLLAGQGARLFAREAGVPGCSAASLIVKEQKRRWKKEHGTVGCVAFDAAGDLAAATSTGGIFDKLPGRVGDSPLIGCGTYADDYGGVSCSGHGEAIIRIVMAKTAATILEEESDPQTAAEITVSALEEMTGGRGGLILIDRRGGVGYARNTPNMPVCSITENETITFND